MQHTIFNYLGKFSVVNNFLKLVIAFIMKYFFSKSIKSIYENKLIISTTIFFLLEYFILGKYSFIPMLDFSDDTFPRYIKLWDSFKEFYIYNWSTDIGAGQNRLSNLVYYDNFMSLLISILPAWLAFQLFVIITTVLGVFGFYKICLPSNHHTKDTKVLISFCAIIFPILICFRLTAGLALGLQYTAFSIYLLNQIYKKYHNSFFKSLFFISIVIYIHSIILHFSNGFIYSIPFILIWLLFIEIKSIKFILIFFISVGIVNLIHLDNYFSLLGHVEESHRTSRVTSFGEGFQIFKWQLPLLLIICYVAFIEKIRDWYIYKIILLYLSLTLGELILEQIWGYLFLNTPIYTLQVDRISWYSPILISLLLFKIVEITKKYKVVLCSTILFYVFTILYVKHENLLMWIKSGNYVANFESKELLRLKNSDSSIFRVSVTRGVTHPNMLNAYGFETSGGFSPMYPMGYKNFWYNVIKPFKSTSSEYNPFNNNSTSRFYLFTGNPPKQNNPGTDDQELLLNLTNVISQTRDGRYTSLIAKDFFSIDLLSLVNTKYIISHQPIVDTRLKLKKGGINAMEFNNIDKLILRLKENFTGRESLFIYENMEYLERAFIVNNLQYYSENKELYENLSKVDIEYLKENAFLDIKYFDDFKEYNKNKSIVYIENITYTPDYISYKVKSEPNKIFVITNNYDKHWNCMVNGKESYLYKLYGSFWGLYLTSDINIIECKYNYPGIYKNIRRFISTKMF